MASVIDSTRRRQCSFSNTGLTQNKSKKHDRMHLPAFWRKIMAFLFSYGLYFEEEQGRWYHMSELICSQRHQPHHLHTEKGGPLEQIGAFCGFFHLASDGILSLFQNPRLHFWEVLSKEVLHRIAFAWKLEPIKPNYSVLSNSTPGCQLLSTL